MSGPKFTRDVRVSDEHTNNGGLLVADSVGRGYFSAVGHATQRDPNPIHGGGISHETARANAHLWAASPDMYEALRDVLDELLKASNQTEWLPLSAEKRRDERISKARAALAKAVPQ